MAKDLSEQKKANFILIVGAAQTQYYYVDSFQQFEDTIRFFDGEDDLVYMCRVTEGNWAVVASDSVGLATEADLVRFSREEHKSEAKFLEDLDPEAYKKAKDLIASGRVAVDEEGQVVMLPAGGPTRLPRTPEEEERLKTGQYL